MESGKGPEVATLAELKVRGERAIATTRAIIRDMKRQAEEVKRDAAILLSGRLYRR